MENQGVTTSENTVGEDKVVEKLLHGLWERVRQAGDLVGELRSQKVQLTTRVHHLENEVERLRKELSSQEDLLRELKEQQSAQGSGHGEPFLNGGREALRAKVRELLGRIEGYL